MRLARSRFVRLLLPAAASVVSPVLHADAGPAHAQAASADEVARVRQSVARDEEAVRRHADELRRAATNTDARILARGRSYVRLSRAGLLPVGDGFEALVEHAVRLERLHHALESDLATAKRLAA